MKKAYKLVEGELQWRFQQSRAKIQVFGGGFGNGKTTSAVVKALQIARDYPGSNGLLARSTYPKLNDTLRKEFLDWCPDAWIKSKNLSDKNEVELMNGSVIRFRYIAQQGKGNESSTSNLLSATYDYIIVDQMEDPEITEKDFLDLLGRLRGSTAYTGDDDTMPRSGPRWLIAMVNPTRNWVYRKLVKPLQDYKNGIYNPDLIFDEELDKPAVELFEGTTYSNKENLPADFIKTLEAAYTGQMRTRYLLGEWGGFEGLVYPQYDATVHMLTRDTMLQYAHKLLMEGYSLTVIEAYDHGLASPACYLQAFVDHEGNVFVFNGYHTSETVISALAGLMKKHRQRFVLEVDDDAEFDDVLADPAVFKRGSGLVSKVGVTVAGLFEECDITMRRANNDILSGINKVQSYLVIDKAHLHPIHGTVGSPRIFFNSDLSFIDQEIVDYYWKRDVRGEFEDKPNDRNDHAMDTLKYLLSVRPRIAGLIKTKLTLPPQFRRWREKSRQQEVRNIRHG